MFSRRLGKTSGGVVGFGWHLTHFFLSFSIFCICMKKDIPPNYNKEYKNCLTQVIWVPCITRPKKDTTIPRERRRKKTNFGNCKREIIWSRGDYMVMKIMLKSQDKGRYKKSNHHKNDLLQNLRVHKFISPQNKDYEKRRPPNL